MPAYLTHGYVASKVRNRIWYLSGNVFADLGGLISLYKRNITLSHRNMKAFTRFLEKEGFHSDFILGIEHHVALDAFAHRKYIVPISKKLAKETGYSEHYIHAHYEFAFARKVLKDHAGFFRTVTRGVKLVRGHKRLRKLLVVFFPAIPVLSILQDALDVLQKSKINMQAIILSNRMRKKYLQARGLNKEGVRYFFGMMKMNKVIKAEVEKNYKKELADYIKYQKKLITNSKK